MGPILPHAAPSEMAQNPAASQNRPFYWGKKSQNKKSKNAVSLHNPLLLRHMKRDFYLANEV